MLRGWLLLLAVDLFAWAPFAFAREAIGSMGTLGMRGPAAIVELAAHAAIAALAVGAVRALRSGNPGAPGFATIAVAASAAGTVQSLYWSVLPADIVPGHRLPLTILAIAHAAGWMTYVRKSRRVRALYP
jgi:hypothetical protein